MPIRPSSVGLIFLARFFGALPRVNATRLRAIPTTAARTLRPHAPVAKRKRLRVATDSITAAVNYDYDGGNPEKYAYSQRGWSLRGRKHVSSASATRSKLNVLETSDKEKQHEIEEYLLRMMQVSLSKSR